MIWSIIVCAFWIWVGCTLHNRIEELENRIESAEHQIADIESGYTKIGRQ